MGVGRGVLLDVIQGYQMTEVTNLHFPGLVLALLHWFGPGSSCPQVWLMFCGGACNSPDFKCFMSPFSLFPPVPSED